MERQFDLNIEKILDNWENYHAVREIIANALDEKVITKTSRISIEKHSDGSWHIRDYGRGLQYHHLTQNESLEKKQHPSVIGKFGVGLKDALAVLYKNRIHVRILSKYGDITFGMRPKKGFPDTRTLHALISPPSDDHMIGTEFILGVSDSDIEKAKSLFLIFLENPLLETTQYGEIYSKRDNSYGAIFVHGVMVAEEPNYLFDYNITKTNKALDKNLNRERSAVGRTAYSELIKKILLNAKSETVIKELIRQLNNIPIGTNCDEVALLDVQIHAIKKYNESKPLVFFPQSRAHTLTNNDREKINESGRELVVVPDTAYEKIIGSTDYSGNEIGTFSTVLHEYNQNFKYEFVDEKELTSEEKYVLALKTWVMTTYGNSNYLNRVYISENINDMTSGDTLGVYDRVEDRIIIKRMILQDAFLFCEVLFHELTHATTGYLDNSRDFENALGRIIRKLSKLVLDNAQSS